MKPIIRATHTLALAIFLLFFPSTAPGFSGKTQVRISRNARYSISQTSLNGLKVMNYYPSANSWENMWTNWNPTVINNDFALIASLNANTVRVIVNVQAFGYPTPSQAMLNKLSQIITLADNNGLMTQLTLFDWWSSYSDITGSETWASAIVSP